MDVDDDEEKRATNAKTQNKGEDDGGFFTAQSSAQPAAATAEDEGIDGRWLNRHDVDLVEKTVEDFRHQRISMVQSLRQYVLCYESVMEWLVDHRKGDEST
jgi:protein-tyrosine phosphatase